MQSDAVTVAIDGFVISLVEAVAIVIVVLLFFMGLRSGLLIGFILVLTIYRRLLPERSVSRSPWSENG
jgi:multidrug efflux pump subunit AcrB